MKVPRDKTTRKATYEFCWNSHLRCMELSIRDTETMFPLVINYKDASKVYRIQQTKAKGLIMSAI
jgi:hypothetical protein